MTPAERRAEAWQARLTAAGSSSTVSYIGGGWFAMRHVWLGPQGCQRGYDIEREVAEIEETHRRARKARRPPPKGKPFDPSRWT